MTPSTPQPGEGRRRVYGSGCLPESAPHYSPRTAKEERRVRLDVGVVVPGLHPPFPVKSTGSRHKRYRLW